MELSLVVLTHGSDGAVLGFDRNQTSPSLPGMDLGLEAIGKAVQGLVSVQADEKVEELPAGYDDGVLDAWCEAEKLFDQGIDRIEFAVAGQAEPVRATLTRAGVSRLSRRLQEPVVHVRSLEGRLLMGDFKESGTRCRVHPAVGEPVECLFDESQAGEILDSLLGFVRVTGEATEDSRTGKIRSLVIQSVERLDGPEHVALRVRGGKSFWDSLSLEQLARSQDVGPTKNVEALFHTWPGDEDDGFEEAVNALRQAGAGTGDVA